MCTHPCTCKCIQAPSNSLFMIKSCHRDVRKPSSLTNMKGRTVVCHMGTTVALLHIQKPATGGGGPDSLSFDKLTWWFDAHITMRTPQRSVCILQVQISAHGIASSLIIWLGRCTSLSKSLFCFQGRNDFYLVFIHYGSSALLFKKCWVKRKTTEMEVEHSFQILFIIFVFTLWLQL